MHLRYFTALLYILILGNSCWASSVIEKDSTQNERPAENSWQIINKGVGGDNSMDLLSRLERDVINERPDMVFIMVGLNDMINLHKFVDYNTFQKCYQKLITRLKNEGIETVLLNLTPVDADAISTSYQESFLQEPAQIKISKANEIIETLAEVNQLKMIDIYEAFRERKTPNPGENSLIMNVANSGTPDGVHPTKEGNKIIAQKIFEYLVVSGKIQGQKKVIFFGDSITSGSGVEGSGTSEGETYPAYLKKMIQWDGLAPYFSRPYEFEAVEGNFKDPFIFEDGGLVKDEADWRERRKEILNKWHKMMGQWPEFIKDQPIEVLETEEKAAFLQKKIRFEWVPGQFTEGYLLIPYGAKEAAAVITVYYEPETGIGKGKPYRDFALQLANRGFVTLSLGTTETTEDETYSIYYPSLDSATVQPLSMLAYAAANAWHLMAAIPEVNAEKIGIVGHSYGGKWAMFASCLFDKFAAAAWSDPGIVFDQNRSNINYWEPWYLGYHPQPWRKRGIPNADQPAKGLYPRLLEEKMDLHELHVLMAPRPFLVSGGEEDTRERWIPLNYSIKANQIYGLKNRVGMTNRPNHAPTKASNEAIYTFFEYFLK